MVLATFATCLIIWRIGVKNNDFISFNIWTECDNGCTFCFDNDCKEHLTLEQKKDRINTVTYQVKNNLNPCYKRLNTLGGELYQGQLKGCEEEWLSFIDALNNSTITQYIINTNLIGDLYFLDETIKALKIDFIIGTSYDSKGRFKSEQQKKSWFDNVNKYLDMGCKVCCTCVITEDLMHDKVVFPDGLYVTLYEPQVTLYKTKSIIEDCLNSENPKETYISKTREYGYQLNLPKRSSFISWAYSHANILQNYLSYNNVHADDVYIVVGNNKVQEWIGERIDTLKNNECEHPLTCLCYEDSDKCLMCDALQVLESV